MLELVEQNQLIEQHSAQHKQLGAAQSLDRDLTTPLEHVLERAVERLNGLRAQLVKDAPHLDPIVGVAQYLVPRFSSLCSALFAKSHASARA